MFQQHYEVIAIIIPILQMVKMRFREVDNSPKVIQLESDWSGWVTVPTGKYLNHRIVLISLYILRCSRMICDTLFCGSWPQQLLRQTQRKEENMPFDYNVKKPRFKCKRWDLKREEYGGHLQLQVLLPAHLHLPYWQKCTSLDQIEQKTVFRMEWNALLC